MIESILIYSLLTLVMTLCGVSIAAKSKRYIARSGVCEIGGKFITPEMLVILFSFAFVFGCRWGVGRDYFRYLFAYTRYIPERFELLFQTISSALQDIGAHFSVYFGVWALLEVFFLYYAARRYKFIFPYIAFFLIFGSQYLSMMNAIRQHLAAGVFMVSIVFIDEGKYMKYFLCCLLAFFFHRLSAVLFLIYPIVRFNNDWFKSIKLQLFLYLIAIILNYNSDLIIKWIEMPFTWLADTLGYTRYRYELLEQARFDRNKFGNNTGLGIYVNMIRTIPIILLSKKLKRFYNSSYFNLIYTFYFVSVLCGLILGNSIILNRITYLFVEFQIILFSLFVYYCFYYKKSYLNIVGALIMLICIPLFLNIISNEASTAQFTFFWEHNY